MARVLWMRDHPPTEAQVLELGLLGLDEIDMLSVKNDKLREAIGFASGVVMETDDLILTVIEWIKTQRYDAIVWGPIGPEYFQFRFAFVLATMEEIHHGHILPTILIPWERIPGEHHHFMKV